MCKHCGDRVQLGLLEESGSELGARKTGMKADWKQASVRAVVEVVSGCLQTQLACVAPCMGIQVQGKLVV